jgi:RimJ/RimL family protein N-acetyltransferase
VKNYKCLNKQVFSRGKYSIVPIRMGDRYVIMKWRNEQIYHLRQNKALTEEVQDTYFNTVVEGSFNHEQPNQILFSFLDGDKCIGYGGLVHINWVDMNAEISLVMDTKLQEKYFVKLWVNFLNLIILPAFNEIKLHKIYTYAFDVRPKLYEALLEAGFSEDARLKDHCKIEGKYLDVLIHSLINPFDQLQGRLANIGDAQLLFEWANESITRKNSFNPDPIKWEDHLDWLNRKLTESTTEIYIFQIGDNPIGVVRFETSDNTIIGITVDPNMQGKGFGPKVLRLACDKFGGTHNNNILAYIKKDNIPSQKIFEKAGFTFLKDDIYQGTDCKVLILKH